jgi:hypothetical protein
MKNRIAKLIIVIWMVLSFLIDLVSALLGGVNGWFVVSLIVIGVVTCWVAYEMLIGKRWALITLMVYWGIRTFNIYTEKFSFYTKSGLNIELSLPQHIGINVLSVIAFILLMLEVRKGQRTALPEDATRDATNG